MEYPNQKQLLHLMSEVKTSPEWSGRYKSFLVKEKINTIDVIEVNTSGRASVDNSSSCMLALTQSQERECTEKGVAPSDTGEYQIKRMKTVTRKVKPDIKFTGTLWGEPITLFTTCEPVSRKQLEKVDVNAIPLNRVYEDSLWTMEHLVKLLEEESKPVDMQKSVIKMSVPKQYTDPTWIHKQIARENEIRKEQEFREKQLAMEKARAEEEARKRVQLELEAEKKRRE